MAEKDVTIGFLDSGAGGLSVLDCFLKHGGFYRAVYFGDNDNAPYGGKSVRELTALAVSGVDKLLSAGAEIAVLACGTLSVSTLTKVRKIFPRTPVFGVFPPVERCLISGRRPAALFATPRTAACLRGEEWLRVFALPDLAKDIEDNLFSLGNVCLGRHIGDTVDPAAVILGCTHYALIADAFAFRFPQAKIYFGAEDALRTVRAFLRYNRVFAEGNAGERGFSQCSDHFAYKNAIPLTTFDAKWKEVQKIGKKCEKTGEFYGKTVKFIGDCAELNFRVYANICSKFTNPA